MSHASISRYLIVLIVVSAAAGCGSSSATTSTETPSDDPVAEPAPATPEETLADAAAIPDIDIFMQILSASSPQRAADGTFYYTTWTTGVDQLYRIPAGAEESEQLTDFEDGLEAFELSPNGAFIVLRTSVGGSEQGDLHLFDTTTAAITPLLVDPEVRYENALWLPDSSGFFFRSNEANGTDFFIYRYDLAETSHTLIAETPGYNWLSDISGDATRLLVTRYHSNANSDVYLYDLTAEGGAVEQLLTPHEGEIQYFSSAFDAHDRVVVTSNRDAEMRGIGHLVGDTGGVEYFVQSEWEVEDAVLADDRTTLAYVTNEDGYGRVHLVNVLTGEAMTPPDLPDGIATLNRFEHGYLTLVFSSATRTHDAWEFGLEDGQVRQVTFSDYQGIDTSLFREPRLIRFESFDGRAIPAFIYLPPDYEGGIVPTIIHVHGGPESQFRPSFARHFQYLMLHGFAILAPNIRGSSGYGSEYLSLDNYQLRLDSIRDIGAAVDWLVGEGISDEAHLGIKGASYGGYAVMAAITEMPERFAAACNTVGIVNFVTFLENTADYRRALREAEYGPLTDLEFLESISPINKVDQIAAPLLVMHGENDSRVPVGEARQIAAALESRGQPVELLIFENEGHGVRHLDNRLVMYRTMVDFFTRYLSETE